MNPNDWQRVTQVVGEAEPLTADEAKVLIQQRLSERPQLSAIAMRMLDELRATDAGLTGQVAQVISELRVAERLEPGSKIAGYSVLSTLGYGGMGTVYLARRDSDDYDMQVALKLMHSDRVVKDESIRDMTEIQLLAELSHPNIARLIDAGVDETHGQYLVTEYVQGEPLLDACKGVSTKSLVKTFLHICKAVAHAHGRLVVHCDIKPANILVDKDDQPKLLDFGIAAALDAAHAKDATTTRAYSPAYASPEQLNGEAIFTATDIYSLGLLFIEMLTGKQQFDHGVGTSNTDDAIQARRNLSPSAQEKMDFELAAIARRCTAFDPADRYPSVASLLEDLDNYLDKQPISSLKPHYRYRLRKFFQRNPRSSIVAGLLGISVAAFAVTASLQARSLATERDRLEHERAAKSASVDFLAGTLTQLDAISPTASELTASVEFLNALANRADEELASVPLAHAETLRLIGDALHTQGDNENAQRVLQKALELSETNTATSPIELAEIHRKLARVAVSEGNFEETIAHLNDAQRFVDSDTGASSVHDARLALVWSSQQRAIGNYPTGLEHAARAVRLFEESLGDADVETAEAIDNLGYQHLFLGDPATASPLFERARQMTADTVGKQHVNYGRQSGHLATAYRELGRLDLADAAYGEAISSMAGALGADHSYVINARTEYGRLLQLTGKLAQAEQQYDAALASARVTFGEQHYQYGIQLLNFGGLHYQSNRSTASRKAYENAQRVITQTLSPNSVFLGAAIVGLALLDLDAGELDSAANNVDKALEIFRAGVGDEHWYYDLAAAVDAMVKTEMNGDDPELVSRFNKHYARFSDSRHPNDFRVTRLSQSRLKQDPE